MHACYHIFQSLIHLLIRLNNLLNVYYNKTLFGTTDKSMVGNGQKTEFKRKLYKIEGESPTGKCKPERELGHAGGTRMAGDGVWRGQFSIGS